MLSVKKSLEKVELQLSLLLSIIAWLAAFVLAMVFMGFLGINPQDPNEHWGLNHPKYWTFELLMTPTFMVLGIIILSFYQIRSQGDPVYWLQESVLVGIIFMLVQFLLDLIFIVILFRNGLEYFIGLVTISYLLIPVWSVACGWYWKGRKN